MHSLGKYKIRTNLNLLLLHSAVAAAVFVHVCPVHIGGHVDSFVVFPAHQHLVLVVEDVGGTPGDGLVLQFFLGFDGNPEVTVSFFRNRLLLLFKKINKKGIKRKFKQTLPEQPVLADCPSGSNLHLSHPCQQGEGREQVVKVDEGALTQPSLDSYSFHGYL